MTPSDPALGDAGSTTPSVAVVSGATGTLGRILVGALAERGLAVVAVSRSGDPVGRGEAIAVSADLADDASVQEIRSALPPGRLAIAVHAVGLPASPGVLDVAPGMLARAVDLKAGGFRRLVDAALPRLGPGSRLVAVGGHLGSEPSEHAPLAGVANAALASLVRQLARPVGRLGATVHLVAPGPFRSPRLEALAAATAVGRGVEVDEVLAEMGAGHPTGSVPTPEDVAWVVTMLLEPSARVLHGATLAADGGVRRGLF